MFGFVLFSNSYLASFRFDGNQKRIVQLDMSRMITCWLMKCIRSADDRKRDNNNLYPPPPSLWPSSPPPPSFTFLPPSIHVRMQFHRMKHIISSFSPSLSLFCFVFFLSGSPLSSPIEFVTDCCDYSICCYYLISFYSFFPPTRFISFFFPCSVVSIWQPNWIETHLFIFSMLKSKKGGEGKRRNYHRHWMSLSWMRW